MFMTWQLLKVVCVWSASVSIVVVLIFSFVCSQCGCGLVGQPLLFALVFVCQRVCSLISINSCLCSGIHCRTIQLLDVGQELWCLVWLKEVLIGPRVSLEGGLCCVLGLLAVGAYRTEGVSLSYTILWSAGCKDL